MGLIDVSIQQFIDFFKNEHQAMEQSLRGTMLEYRGIVGDAYKIPVVDQIILHDKGAAHSDIPATIPAYSRVTIEFSNKIANLPVDIFEQAEVNASALQNYAKIAAAAVARQEDQIKIDALEATTTSNVIADGGTNLTVDKLREIVFYLDKNNVPPQNRYYLGHANQKESLLAETEVSSSDYNVVKALVNGDVNTFLGLKFIWIGDRDEGGLSKTGDIRVNFAWHMDSVACAYGLVEMGNPSVDIGWDLRSQNHLVIPKLRMGAKELLPAGIVKISCDETA